MTNDRDPIPSNPASFGSNVIPAVAYGAEPLARLVLSGGLDVSSADGFSMGLWDDETQLPAWADLAGRFSTAGAFGGSVPEGGPPPLASVPSSWQLVEEFEPGSPVQFLLTPYEYVPGSSPLFVKFEAVDPASGCSKALIIFIRNPSVFAHNEPGESYVSFDEGHSWTTCVDPSTTITFDGPPSTCPERPKAVPVIIARDDDKTDFTIAGDVHLDSSTMPGADAGAHVGHVNVENTVGLHGSGDLACSGFNLDVASSDDWEGAADGDTVTNELVIPAGAGFVAIGQFTKTDYDGATDSITVAGVPLYPTIDLDSIGTLATAPLVEIAAAGTRFEAVTVSLSSVKPRNARVVGHSWD